MRQGRFPSARSVVSLGSNSVNDGKHIEGILVGPTVVALGMGGMFHKYFMDVSFRPEEFHNDAKSFKRLLDFFVWLGWFSSKNGTYSFTDVGLFYASNESAV